MKINATQATDYITQCIQVGLTPMISGDPGIGKSEIVKAIAEKYSLVLVDERLSTYDPTDLNGLPKIGTERASFIPFDTFPLEDTPIPPGSHGWLIFLDEFNSATMAVQSAAYRLILDKSVGRHKLHPRAVIVCAGNLATSGAIVNRLGTAMQSRLIHLELFVSVPLWLTWASTHGIDYRILSYINNVPENLLRFDPKHTDKTFASPRTWEFTSRLISKLDTKKLSSIIELLAGSIGEGVAMEFVSHCEIYNDMPTFAQIQTDPLSAKCKKEPAIQFAVAYMIAAFVDTISLTKAMQYVARLPLEFQTICIQGIVRKNKAMLLEKPVISWMALNGSLLI